MVKQCSVQCSALDKNQRKLRVIESLTSQIMDLLHESQDWIGYYFGAAYIAAGTMSIGDLVAFVSNSRMFFGDINGVVEKLTGMKENLHEIMELSRFHDLHPKIGLTGGFHRPEARQLPKDSCKIPPLAIVVTVEAN